jgi:hypothetical protein
MNNERMTVAELEEEARKWAAGEMPSGEFVDAPEAVPRARESVAISIRLPKQMVDILKEFARRSGIGYQVLMKRWLDDRICLEHGRLKKDRKRRRGQKKKHEETHRLHGQDGNDFQRMEKKLRELQIEIQRIIKGLEDNPGSIKRKNRVEK